MGKKSKSKKFPIRFFMIICTIFILMITLVVLNVTKNRVKGEVVIELGDELPNIKTFLIDKNDKGSFLTDVSKINLKEAGSYYIKMKVDKVKYKSLLIIKDTVAPVIKAKELQIYKDNKITADSFVDSIQELGKYKIYYEQEPAFDKPGVQQLNIVAEDASGNKAVATVKLTILEDKIAPVISGAKDQVVYLGDTISYKKGVTATDDVDGEIVLEVDNSKVSLDKIGVYEVVYSAKDKAGNITTVSKKVNVVEKVDIPISLEEINALADEVLSQITNDTMSQVEKARAIHTWVKGNIRYIDHSDKNSWVKGAYEGLTTRKGDCFVYFATAKILLSRAGIDNIDVKEINGKHYWNMINCGTGWYHFDATRFIDNVDIFMWTDSKIDKLYITGVRLHNWDKSTTPPTPES